MTLSAFCCKAGAVPPAIATPAPVAPPPPASAAVTASATGTANSTANANATATAGVPAPATAPERAGEAAVPDPFAPAPAGGYPALTDAAIHQAIHDTLAEADRQAAAERQAVANKQMQPGVAPGGVVYRGNVEADVLSAAFDQGQIPDCLHPDGLKFQPTYIFFGLLALPFVAVAKMRGKCN